MNLPQQNTTLGVTVNTTLDLRGQANIMTLSSTAILTLQVRGARRFAALARCCDALSARAGAAANSILWRSTAVWWAHVVRANRALPCSI